MSDEEVTPPPTDLPPPYQIPADRVVRWTSIPEEAFINAPLRRVDIDNLFFAIKALSESLVSFDSVIVNFSNNQTDQANEAMMNARRLVRASLDLNLKFMSGVMEHATIADDGNG